MSGKERGGYSHTKKGETGRESTEQGRISELVRGEQKAWKNVLGARVDIAPLPEYVMPEAQRNLEKLGFEKIIYMPKLNLKTVDYLRSVGVDRYLEELQEEYPKWKNFESLSDSQRGDHTISRNLEKDYWEKVLYGNIDFPNLPGQWMAVETVAKPPYGKKYSHTAFAEKLGFGDDRFNVSWSAVHTAIEREKRGILGGELGLERRPADIRLLEALEWNLLGNREGWGKTNTYEWTNIKHRGSGDSNRLVVGGSDYGGAAFVLFVRPDLSLVSVGFRSAVVLGS